MKVVAVSPILTRTETAVGSTHGVRSASFKAILTSLRNPASEITSMPPQTVAQASMLRELGRVAVHQGDSLSRICSERLTAQDQAVSHRAIYAAVKVVAKANHIADPDKIYIGQTLDLSMLAASAAGAEKPSAVTVHEGAKPWQSLVKDATALSSGFGLRKDPFTGQMHQHNGIDVAAPTGAPIQAIAAGSVIFSGWKAGFGKTVIIRHEDGSESLYGHASRLLVHVGEQVADQTPIGSVGSTGRATGPHLHFEVRKKGKALNPTALLQGDSLPVA